MIITIIMVMTRISYNDRMIVIIMIVILVIVIIIIIIMIISLQLHPQQQP